MENASYHPDFFLSKLFDTADISVLGVTDVGLINYCNDKFCSDWNFNRQSVIGTPIVSLVHLPECTSWIDFLYLTQNEVKSTVIVNLGNIDRPETKAYLSIGSVESAECLQHVCFFTLLLQQENVPGNQSLEAAMHATAEMKQLQRKLIENKEKNETLVLALEQEKEISNTKSRFVSIASHEFRTPLAGILSSTYLLSKYTKENEQPLRDKHIKRITTSVKLLNEVLNDFLSVDKIEQGAIHPSPTFFNIAEVAEASISDLQPLLKSGQKIRYFRNESADMAYLDQSMFHDIVTNLLSNAIKFSGADSLIELTIYHHHDSLVLKVKDQGIGIPRDEQSNLFTRFFRGSNALHIQGTGLGLSIVDRYVKILDGIIKVTSEVGSGTEFTITFNHQKDIYEETPDR